MCSVPRKYTLYIGFTIIIWLSVASFADWDINSWNRISLQSISLYRLDVRLVKDKYIALHNEYLVRERVPHLVKGGGGESARSRQPPTVGLISAEAVDMYVL